MLLFPGQGVREFECVRQKKEVNNFGRVIDSGEDQLVLKFMGMITSASQREVEQWKQSGHPISHKIVQALPAAYDGDYPVAGDTLKLGERFFTVQGMRNPGELDHYRVYYCEERIDLIAEDSHGCQRC